MRTDRVWHTELPGKPSCTQVNYYHVVDFRNCYSRSTERSQPFVLVPGRGKIGMICDELEGGRGATFEVKAKEEARCPREGGV